MKNRKAIFRVPVARLRGRDIRYRLSRTAPVAPRNAAAWFNVGYVCDQQHNTEAARAAFEEAVRLDPKLDHAWYGLGLCHGTRGDHAAAVHAFERVIQLEPMNWHAWYELGMAQHRAYQPDKVKSVVEHLNRYDRHRARKLILDTERSDLAHLVADLRVK